MSRTFDLGKTAEQIASIIRQRTPDAIVDVETDLRTGIPHEVSVTWRRLRGVDVRLRVKFYQGDGDAREAKVNVLWGSTDCSAAGAVTFARLMTDVSAIACEIDALTDGYVFTTGKE